MLFFDYVQHSSIYNEEWAVMPMGYTGLENIFSWETFLHILILRGGWMESYWEKLSK